MSLQRLLGAIAVWSLVAGCEAGSAAEGTQDVTSKAASDVVMEKAPRRPGQISVRRSESDSWEFSVVGQSGAPVLLSQAYVERTSAVNGILSVEENGVDRERYAVRASDGGLVVELKAGNGQVIAESRPLRTEEEAAALIDEARDLVAGIVQYKAALAKGARFDLSRDVAGDGKWSFSLLDEKGRALLLSQKYAKRTAAVTGLESVRLNGKDEARYQINSEDGITVSLVAANGEEIAGSGVLADEAQAQALITETQALLKSERVANPW